MPNSRKTEIRYKVLDRCLKRGGYSTQQLMDEVNREFRSVNEEEITSLNTIRNDLANMETTYRDQIHIVDDKGADRRYITYRYEDPSMSIYKLPFKEEELAQLIQCMELLKRFRGVPNMNWLNDFIDRFSLSIDAESDGVVGFDVCDELMGRQYFGRILTAITSKRVLKIKYRKFGAKDSWNILVHPYYLKEYNGRWFLLCLNNMYLSITTLGTALRVSFAPIPSDGDCRPTVYSTGLYSYKQCIQPLPYNKVDPHCQVAENIKNVNGVRHIPRCAQRETPRAPVCACHGSDLHCIHRLDYV